jgi:hypothetical protein
MTREVEAINGEPSLIVRVDGKVLVVLSISIDQGQVREVRVIGNPDKLKWVGGDL